LSVSGATSTTPGRWRGARDSSAAAAATLRRHCRPAATSAPRVTHAPAAPCITPSRCQFVGDVVSPLPVTTAERRHSALLSPRSSAPSSLHSIAPSTEAPTTPHHPRVPLRHGKPTVEPLSTAGNHQSTEPAASFSCRGRPPVERHLRPLTCSSVIAATSPPRTPSRRSPPLLWPTVAGSQPPTCITVASPPR
jgi:hypothetical protein